MRYPSLVATAPRHRRALTALALPSLFAWSTLLTGCSDDPVTPEPVAAGTVALTDANNFTTETNHLKIGTIQTAAQADLSISWAGIVNDVQCHPVDDPAEIIDDVVLLRVESSSQEEVTAWLDSGELGESKLAPGGFSSVLPKEGVTSARLSDFVTNDSPFELGTSYVEDDEITYLLLFQTGTTPGHGARTMTFLEPGPKSNTQVDAPANDPCTLLDFKADLTSLTPVQVPKNAPWILSWAGVKEDSQGNPLAAASISRLLLGFYANKTVQDLEDDFLNLEISDTESWELALKATKEADLSSATNRNPAGNHDGSGTKFAGFDQEQEGTWIMGLFCDSCQSPAPLIVTILEPSE